MAIKTKSLAELIELGDELLKETEKAIAECNPLSHEKATLGTIMKADLFNVWSTQVIFFLTTNEDYKDHDITVWLVKTYKTLNPSQNKAFFDKAIGFLKGIK